MSCNNIFKAEGGCIALILTHTGESESSLSQIPDLRDTFFFLFPCLQQSNGPSSQDITSK